MRLSYLVKSPLGRIALLSVFGLTLGLVGGQEVTRAECPKNICEQDIWWDDCIPSPDPTGHAYCHFVGSECSTRDCNSMEN